jgi:hypothetical protein
MSNSNDDRRSSAQHEGEKGSKGQQQQGSGQGKSSGGQQGGHQSHGTVPVQQQGGKDHKGGQRHGGMNDDEQGTGRGTQQPNKNSNPDDVKDHDRDNEARRKGARSE